MSLSCAQHVGSGKTAAFLVPLVEKLREHHLTGGVRGIVLSPTRELAYQSYRVCNKVCHYTSLRSCVLVGGEAIEAQFEALSKQPDIIFATPGRLMHMLLEIPNFSLASVQFISCPVLWRPSLHICYDEADQLFELGFAPQLNDITRRLPVNRQSMLVSATLPPILMEFSRAGLHDPEIIRLDTDSKLSPNLCSTFFMLRKVGVMRVCHAGREDGGADVSAPRGHPQPSRHSHLRRNALPRRLPHCRTLL